MRRVLSAGGPAKARLEAADELRLYLASSATLKVCGGPARGMAPAASPGPGRTTYVILRTRPCADHASSPAQSRSPHLSQAPAIVGSLRWRGSPCPGALPWYPQGLHGEPERGGVEADCVTAGEEALRAAEQQRTPAGSCGEQGAGVGVEGRGGAQAAQGEGTLAQPGCCEVQPGCHGLRPARVGEDDRER